MAQSTIKAASKKASHKGGRPPTLGPEHTQALRQITREMPRATLAEVTQELLARTATQASLPTVRKALRAAGIQRVRPHRRAAPRAPVQGRAPARYGYTQAHRRADGASGMNTDLTDAEWALVADLFEREGGRGAPPRYGRRQVLDACCYVLRTGCPWRLLPKSFPPWQAVYKAFSRWAAAGLLERVHERLRQQWRQRIGRAALPTQAVIDAQSTRGSPQGGDNGFDAGKKVKGRKRHLVVDTLGLLLAVVITAASVQDRDAASMALAQARAKAPTLATLYADGAYAGRCAQALHDEHGVRVQIVRSPHNRYRGHWVQAQQPLWPELSGYTFAPLPKRWVVERTHAWNERARRLMVHHDRSNRSAVAWVWLAETRLLATRLAG